MTTQTLSRRKFIRNLGTAALGGVVAETTGLLTAHAQEFTRREYLGNNMSSWEMALGDGIFAVPEQEPVSDADIAAAHSELSSELQANIQQRGIMAHNILFKQIIDGDALQFIHKCRYQFRLPFLPTTGNIDLNSQTLEGGIFIWDGMDSRLDYGMAFQWILNPWMSSFGTIRYWEDRNGGQWATAGYLEPDTNWHQVEMTFDYRMALTTLVIDGNQYRSAYSATAKAATWGTETAVRLQAEIVSLWPGSNQTAPQHQAQFRNWAWIWQPYT